MERFEIGYLISLYLMRYPKFLIIPKYLKICPRNPFYLSKMKFNIESARI